MRRDRLDGFGVAALSAIALLLAFNQIVIAWVNQGLQPVFFAGLRSVLATAVVAGWMWARGRPARLRRPVLRAGLLVGTIFAMEFLLLFVALDLTTVGRTAIIFYSMPVWLALMAHFGLPGERLTPVRLAGLGLAFAGTVLAILDGRTVDGGSLLGDLCALGAALGWAGSAFVARREPLRSEGPETQLFWMVVVSGPILLLAAPAFGPLVREFQPAHLLGLLFQSTVVVAGGFIAWLWLLSVYPAALVSSFSFLTPVLSVALGWLLLGEHVGAGLVASLALVAMGIWLINRPA